MPWHLRRALVFFVGFLAAYAVWLQCCVQLGWTAPSAFLVPLLPAAGYDLWLRLRWRQALPTIYPPPPTRFERLTEREYGLYWPPVLLPIPVWLSVAALLGGLGAYAVQ